MKTANKELINNEYPVNATWQVDAEQTPVKVHARKNKFDKFGRIYCIGESFGAWLHLEHLTFQD